MDHSQKIYFISNTVPRLLLQLNNELKGKWGVLSAQQMIEHLSESVRVANGKRIEKIITSPENLDRIRNFMLSDKPFKENTKNIQMPDIPPACVHKNIAEAVSELKKELYQFNACFSGDESKIITNPIFGDLNFEQWTHLLHKHFEHHCRQFGLI